MDSAHACFHFVLIQDSTKREMLKTSSPSVKAATSETYCSLSVLYRYIYSIAFSCRHMAVCIAFPYVKLTLMNIFIK